MLSVSDHRRDYSGFRYVYPVVSRRAGGVSLGINLNPNNACNWACIYCQVPDLKRGGPPPIDLALLDAELSQALADIVDGDFMQREVPPQARRLMDIAFSGNGEPTSAAEFSDAVAATIAVMRRHALPADVKLRLITNGSLLHREDVRRGIAAIGEIGGEIWFKIDRGSASGMATVNQVSITPDRQLANLLACAELAPTWIQTCWFGIDGAAPDAGEEDAYLALIAPAAEKTRGVHLYGLARPSLQEAAPRLLRLSPDQLARFAARIGELGIAVSISP